MNKKLIAVVAIIAFFCLAAATNAHALWGKPSEVKQESYDRLVKKNLELNAKIDSLVKDYENFKERYRLLMERVKSLQYEKERLLKENRLSKFTVSGSESEIKNLKKKLSETEARLSRTEGVPAEKAAEAEKYKKRASMLEGELNATRSEIQAMEKDLKEAVMASEDRTMGAEREKDEFEKKLKADLNAQYAIRRTQNEKITALSDEIQKLRSVAKKEIPKESELRALKDRVNALQAENAGIRKNLNELKKSYGSKEGDATSLNAIVRKLKADLKTQDAIRNTQDDKIKSLEKDLKTARSELDTQYASRNTQDDKIKSLEKKLQFAQKEIQSAAKSQKSTEKNLETTRSNLKTREKELETQDAIRNTQDEKIKSLEKDLKSARSDLKAKEKDLKEGIKVLGAEQQKLEAENKALEKELKTMDDGRGTMDEKIKGLEKDLNTQHAIRKTQDEKIKSLEKDLKTARSGLKASEKDLKTQDAIRNTQDDKINALEKKFETARSELKAKEAELKEAAKASDAGYKKLEAEKAGFEKKLEAEFKVRYAEVKAKDKEIRLLDSKLESGKKKLETVKADFKKRKTREKEKTGKLTADIKDLKKELRDTRSELKKEISGLKKENSRLAAEEKYARRAQKAAERREEQVRKSVDEVKAKLNKERLDMHYNLAVVFDKAGMYKDAEREYLKCLALKPDDAGVHYNLGILYDDKLNNNHKAKTYYTRFLELRPMGDDTTCVKDWLFNIEQENRLGVEMR